MQACATSTTNRVSLLIEYGGATDKDYIWLDDLPVAVIDTNASDGTAEVSYVHADGLSTPRAIADETGQTIWSWSATGNPFGEQPPQSNGYVYNLRYPGQYYDAETGLHYNINRYYDRMVGRYTQAGPVGFAGGQASWYAYVSGNPLSHIDPFGLDDTFCRIDPASCGWSVNAPVDSNISVGVSQTGAAAIAVESTGWGFAADTTPNMCFYATICGAAATAMGVYKGAGIDGSIGTGGLTSGDSITAIAGYGAGEGGSAGGTVQYDPTSNQVSGTRGFLGAGEGAWAGILACKTHYYCVRDTSRSTSKPNSS